LWKKDRLEGQHGSELYITSGGKKKIDHNGQLAGPRPGEEKTLKESVFRGGTGLKKCGKAQPLPNGIFNKNQG